MYHLWDAFQDEWNLFSKVTFDGVNKLIVVNSDSTTLDIKSDVYSAWKRWTETYDYAKYLPAIRSTGGDPVGGGKYTGDVYFLINDWRIYIDHTCAITGVIYSDDFPSPYIQASGSNIVSNTVSNLVQTVATGGGGSTDPETIANAVWNAIAAANNTLGTMGNKVNTAAQAGDPWATNLSSYTGVQAGKIVNDMSTNVVTVKNQTDTLETGVSNLQSSINSLPSSADNANAVWNKSLSSHTTIGTFGHYIQKKLLSIGKFIGLK